MEAGMKVNENWLVQTITHYIIGTIETFDEKEIWFKSGTVSWIANTGRFYNFMRVGVVEETEVEPFCDVPVMVKQGAIVIAAKWVHPLPEKQQ